MKKIPLFLIFSVSFFIFLAGCLGSSENETGNIDDDSGNVSDSVSSNGAGNNSGGPADSAPVRVQMTFDGGEAVVTLADSPTVRSFLKQLPMTVVCSDFAGAEKIFYLPERLATEAADAGYDPRIGDFACYGPWGNIAVYYRDQPYASGLIYMGVVDSGLDSLAQKNGDFDVTFEISEESKEGKQK